MKRYIPQLFANLPLISIKKILWLSSKKQKLRSATAGVCPIISSHTMCFFQTNFDCRSLLIRSRPEFLWSQSMDKAIDYVNMVHAVYLHSFLPQTSITIWEPPITFRTDFQTSFHVPIWDFYLNLTSRLGCTPLPSIIFRTDFKTSVPAPMWKYWMNLTLKSKIIELIFRLPSPPHQCENSTRILHLDIGVYAIYLSHVFWWFAYFLPPHQWILHLDIGVNAIYLPHVFSNCT